MQPPSTTSNGETPVVEVAASTSHDPESADVDVDVDADTKMPSANNSIAEDMSISTLSVEPGESETKPPNNVDTAAIADRQEETSVPGAAAVDETSACPIEQSGAGPSASHREDKVEKYDKKISSNSEPAAKSLPTFPALPSSGAVTDTSPSSRRDTQGSTKSTADNEVVTSTSSRQQNLETPPSPSIAIAKRPKPGGVASSSKLRAANMPNNPNRGDDSSNSTASTAAAAANVTPLRRGKWTKEEEEYAAMVIQMFNAGYLPAPAGT